LPLEDWRCASAFVASCIFGQKTILSLIQLVRTTPFSSCLCLIQTAQTTPVAQVNYMPEKFNTYSFHQL